MDLNSVAEIPENQMFRVQNPFATESVLELSRGNADRLTCHKMLADSVGIFEQ
jgi:hypothetical protein